MKKINPRKKYWQTYGIAAIILFAIFVVLSLLDGFEIFPFFNFSYLLIAILVSTFPIIYWCKPGLGCYSHLVIGLALDFAIVFLIGAGIGKIYGGIKK